MRSFTAISGFDIDGSIVMTSDEVLSMPEVPKTAAVIGGGITGLVAAREALPDDRWSWSWQSAGRSPEPWAGPDLGEHLEELAARGVRDVVVVPVGFVSDHVELLFDVDERARAVADGLGVRLERPPALNDDPVFVQTLATLVRERAEPWLREARAA